MAIVIKPLPNRSTQKTISIISDALGIFIDSYQSVIKNNSIISTWRTASWVIPSIAGIVGFLYQAIHLLKMDMLWAFSGEGMFADTWVIGLPMVIILTIALAWIGMAKLYKTAYLANAPV